MGSTSLIGLCRGMRVAPLVLACSVTLVGVGGVGCVGIESESDSEPTQAAQETPRGRVAIGEFVLHLQPKLGRASMHPVTPTVASKATALGNIPSLSPQVFTDMNLQEDGTANSGPASSVELVTDPASIFVNDVAQCGSSTSFCANVTLNSFWARHLSNVHAEITSILDANGNAITGHGATNSDNPPSTCTPTSGCPSNSLGLWRYTQSGADPGVINTNGTATRQWRFANPDDADTYVKVRVVATLAYSTYTLSQSFRTVTNACTNGGTQVPTTANTRTASMPFAATFYNLTSTTVRFNRNGLFSIGGSVTNTGNNVLLPDVTAAAPAAFIFWDALAYGTSGMGMCFLTAGTAPARQFIMTWQDMTFTGATTASHMTFSAAVHEGSDEIDFYYQTMTGPNQRSRGNSATVGSQDPTGTVAASGSTYNSAVYTTGKSLTLIPVP